jgi:hypothetical protein
VVKCIGILLEVLTPHKLSEGCLEWCSFICVVFGSGVMFVGVLCFVLVEGLTLGI